jgi:hypothetical protein
VPAALPAGLAPLLAAGWLAGPLEAAGPLADPVLAPPQPARASPVAAAAASSGSAWVRVE